MIQDNPDDETTKKLYRCPHCRTTYSDERFVRVHITRAEDDLHQNRNGAMPEESIEVVNDAGDVVDTISRRPKDIDLTDVTCADFPDDLSKKRVHTLVVAAHNPTVTTRRRITELVQDRLDANEYETEAPTERTVGRALDDFYHPHEDGDDETGTELAELTTLQQAIIITHLDGPDRSNGAIADHVRCAKSYPGQVLDKRAGIVERLAARRTAGESLGAVIKDPLSATDLTSISKQLASELSVDLTALRAEMTTSTDDTTADTPDAAADGAGTDWGTPRSHHGVVTAAPEDHLEDDSDDAPPTSNRSDQRTLIGATPVDNRSTDADNNTGVSTEESDTPISSGPSENSSHRTSAESSNDSSAGQSVVDPGADLIAQIQEMQRNVRFFTELYEAVDDQGQALALSVAKQVDKQCEAMLRSADRS